VLVAHGGVLDMLYRLATGLDLQAPRTWLVTNASINRLLWTPQGLTLAGPTHSTLTWAPAMKPSPDTALQHPLVGQRVYQIDSPALVVDLDAMERNITRMADFARKHGAVAAPRQRPPQRRAGPANAARRCRGRLRAKIAEAEVLAAGGVRDITLTNQVVAYPKLLRVARLAARLQAQGGRLALAVDSPEGITRLAEAMAQAAPQTRIDVLVEIDGPLALRRAPGEPALALAQAVARLTQLRFAGLQAFQGRAQHAQRGQRRSVATACVQSVRATCERIQAAGLGVPLVTAAAPARWCTRPPAASAANCRRAPSCSWMPTTRATNASPPNRLSSMRCTSRHR
jgi:D-serine deaminase-like pyridoxal phosphate-dependent protein